MQLTIISNFNILFSRRFAVALAYFDQYEGGQWKLKPFLNTLFAQSLAKYNNNDQI
jgi:hypothetical protein